MKSTIPNSNLAVIIGLTFVVSSASNAATIFNASTSNTTLVTNGTISAANSLPTLTEDSGTLTLTSNTTSLDNSGFVSTQTINALNGTPLTTLDTVTIGLSVTSVTGATVRANGVAFGIVGQPDFFNNIPGDFFLAQAEAQNSGADVQIVNNSFQDSLQGASGPDATNALIASGFDFTLVADVNGYEFTLAGVSTTSPISISGTFTGNEFVENFGDGHFYYSAQRINNTNASQNLISEVTVASIDVTTIPEPSAFALVGLSGLGLLLRRRRA